jgi:outer membrane protein assembly factor BamD
MQERLNNAKIAYANLMKVNVSAARKEKADAMLAQIDKNLQQYSNIN